MGKKRSKTAKQIQNKAAKKLAQSFAKKLGVSAESSSQRTALTKPAPHKKKRNTKTALKAEKRKQQQQQQQAKVIVSRETLDFAKDQAAVQERNLAVIEWKRKTNRRRQQKLPPQKPQALDFAAPTLCLLPHQKSTNQLIQETTQKVQSTNVFGGAYSGVPQNMAITEPLSLQRWSPTAAAVVDKGNEDSTTTIRHDKHNNNPFAVLQQQDEESPQNATTTATFNFAPPSFTFSTTAVDTTTSFDPDL